MEHSHMHKTDKTGNKRIWLFVALGVLLLLSVFRALGFVTEALALEQQPRCGMTEHLHTESCYINDVLVCRQKAHTHSDSCYPLLLADNDINQLLTQIASTRDRSLESLLRSGNVRGILVLNKDLRVQTTQEDNAEADYPWIGGVGLLAVNDTPSTASNAINFYIRLDGNITCIGSKTLTTSRNIRQLSKTNAVSAYTVLEGTLRTFQDEVFDHITRRAAEIGQDVQKETGCQISVRFSQGYPPVYNDPALYEQAAALLAPDRLVPLKEPALIAEDFSFYQQELPGLFFFLGTGSDQPLHSDRFCFDESVLEQGVALYQTLLQL